MSDAPLTALEHITCYVEHRRAVDRLFASRPPELGWGAVAAFYTALHLVQAYLLTKGTRFEAGNHGARRAAMRQAPELRTVALLYEALRGASEDVRYNPRFVPTEAVRDDALQALARIESILVPKIRRKGYEVP